MRTLITFFLLVVLAVGGWAAWLVYAPVTPRANTSLLLHPGFSTRRIAFELKRAGVIRNEYAFLLWHVLHPRPSLKAGEYVFERRASLPEVYGRIVRGDIYFHVVTIPEGYTMFDIARAMEDAGLGPASDFLRIAETRTDLISDLAPEAKSLEGYLFPNTYQFTRTQSLAEMAAAMVHEFRVVAGEIGLAPQGVKPRDLAAGGGTAEAMPVQGDAGSGQPGALGKLDSAGGDDRSSDALRQPRVMSPRATAVGGAGGLSMTVAKIVTMASIVEKETADPEERPRVASVYYNRLALKMALDADPTVIYGELLAGTYAGSLHHADMAVDSPYNTYRFAGLPPGPIGNPGRSSLEAALHPETTDFLYFVSDGNGHHRFARSIEEHNRNVAAYRRAVGLRPIGH